MNNNYIWGLGMGIGDWGLGPIPNPQSPIPNPQFVKVKINFFSFNLFIVNKYNYYNK